MERILIRTVLSLAGLACAALTGVSLEATPTLLLDAALSAIATLGIAILFLTTVPDQDRKAWIIQLVVTNTLVFAVAIVATPIFNQARESDVPYTCVYQQKQLATGFAFYASDNNDYFPPAERWYRATASYLKGQSYHCPSSTTRYSYAMNEPLSKAKTQAIPKPAETVLTFECASQTPNPTGTQPAFQKRHHGRGSLAYADGHARLSNDAPNQNLWHP